MSPADRPIRIAVQLQPQHCPDYGQLRDAVARSEDAGVDVSQVRTTTERTALAFVTLGEGGERDFAFYRAYVGKDGKPAAYDEGNVPYQPKQWLRFADKPLREGDFVMVAGYPGRTARYALASEFQDTQDWQYPTIVRHYKALQKMVAEAGKANPDIEVKYASTMRGWENVYKNYDSQLAGFERDRFDGNHHLATAYLLDLDRLGFRLAQFRDQQQNEHDIECQSKENSEKQTHVPLQAVQERDQSSDLYTDRPQYGYGDNKDRRTRHHSHEQEDDDQDTVERIHAIPPLGSRAHLHSL